MTAPIGRAFRCTYLLPIRRISTSGQEIEESVRYFRDLAEWVRCFVVDGSPSEIFEEHHRCLATSAVT